MPGCRLELSFAENFQAEAAGDTPRLIGRVLGEGNGIEFDVINVSIAKTNGEMTSMRVIVSTKERLTSLFLTMYPAFMSNLIFP